MHPLKVGDILRCGGKLWRLKQLVKMNSPGNPNRFQLTFEEIDGTKKTADAEVVEKSRTRPADLFGDQQGDSASKL